MENLAPRDREEGGSGEMGQLMFMHGFEHKKAAQIAKWFVRIAGGRIEKLKLIKLFYIAEREYMRENDEPMLFDEFYSLEHGPICSSVLDGINGKGKPGSGWEDFGRKGREISHDEDVNRDDLDHVSDADLDVVEAVWSKFGWMNSSQLRKYTHKNFPEYQEVCRGERSPIQYSDLFEAIDNPDPLRAADEVTRHRRLSRYFVE